MIVKGTHAISVEELRGLTKVGSRLTWRGRKGPIEPTGDTIVAMDASEIESLIREALPDAQMTIEDLRGDGDHYAALVVSAAFGGKSRVQQHQMVYGVARSDGLQLHALALQTSAPESCWRRRREEVDMTENPVFARIQQEVEESPVVVFMKGTPMFPQCGFSAAVVQALTNLGVKFKGIDVLRDPSLREGIKQYTNWPTIPQLYVKGEFVGGCDIVREMYGTGELQQLFEEKKVDFAD